jgi:hypothetical protein
MSISLDHERSQNLLNEAANAARRGEITDLGVKWREMTAKLGSLCPHGKSSTVIAALGTALLAKATDDRVDVYSLLDRGEAPDSYSARSLADNVWARHRARLDVDLGANGVNPLNNTPFIGKTRIDEITGVRNQDGWQCFLECMEALKALNSSDEACEALRGFILARSRSVLPALIIDPQAGDNLTATGLVQLVVTYVAQDSEGGRRAQACVAAMLDTVFGEERVGYSMAFEVKDKPIWDHHLRSSIEKTVKDHGLTNLSFVAVSRQQEISDFDGVIQWAAVRGVKMTVFLNWQSVYLACKCFAPATTDPFEGRVFRRILARSAELGVTDKAMLWLHKATNPDPDGEMS